jgi:hypothetical protein
MAVNLISLFLFILQVFGLKSAVPGTDCFPELETHVKDA